MKTSFRLPDDLHERALAKCKREDVTLSQVIRRILREWVKDEPPQDERQEEQAEQS